MDVERKAEELVCRGEGRTYAGVSAKVAQARAAADQLTELADQHAEDNLDDPAAMAALETSLAIAARLVGDLENWGAPSEGPACMPRPSNIPQAAVSSAPGSVASTLRGTALGPGEGHLEWDRDPGVTSQRCPPAPGRG